MDGLCIKLEGQSFMNGYYVLMLRSQAPGMFFDGKKSRPWVPGECDLPVLHRLRLAIEAKIRLFVSPAILTENSEVLSRKKFGFSPEVTGRMIIEIESLAEIITPVKKYSFIKRDSDDTIIMDCAIEAGANYVVNGDDDLLSIGECEGIRIVSARQFIEIINRSKRGRE